MALAQQPHHMAVHPLATEALIIIILIITSSSSSITIIHASQIPLVLEPYWLSQHWGPASILGLCNASAHMCTEGFREGPERAAQSQGLERRRPRGQVHTEFRAARGSERTSQGTNGRRAQHPQKGHLTT